jgi:spoIIIJ-associated protein
VEAIEKTGASVEEAVEAALVELGLSEQEAEVEVLQEPRSGLLGLGSQQAIVRVGRRRARVEVSQEQLEEQAEQAAEFLEGLMEKIGLDVDVEPHYEDGTMYVDLWGAESDEEMGLLIGRHGQGLESLQEVARGVVGHRTGGRCLVAVDVEDYLKRRRERIVTKAQSLAHRVRRTGKPQRMEPMNAFERKIAHDAVAEIDGVDSASEGEDPQRRVVITRSS